MAFTQVDGSRKVDARDEKRERKFGVLTAEKKRAHTKNCLRMRKVRHEISLF